MARSAREHAATPPNSRAGGATRTSASVLSLENSRLAVSVNRVFLSTLNCCDPDDAFGPMSGTSGSAPTVTLPVAAHATVTGLPAQTVRGFALNDWTEAQPALSTTTGTMPRRIPNLPRCLRIHSSRVGPDRGWAPRVLARSLMPGSVHNPDIERN